MKNIEINFFSPFLPYNNGISTYSEDLIRFLTLQNIKVNKVNKNFWSKCGIIRVYNSRPLFALNKIFAMMLDPFYLPPQKVKIINHFQVSGGQHNYIALKYFNKLKGPKIITMHEAFFYTRNIVNPISEISQMDILKKCDYIVVHTQELKDRISFINKNVVIIRHGVDINKYNKNQKEAKEYLKIKGKMVSCIGYLFRYKGIENFIKAAKGINSEIFIIGSGPSERELKKITEFLSPGKIKFIPFVSEDDLANYIAASDVIIFPRIQSKGEASGILVKAMSASKAILASNSPSFREYLAPDRGILVEPNNIKQLQTETNKLLKNDELRKELGKKSREFAVKYLDWNKIALQHKKLYEKLLHK